MDVPDAARNAWIGSRTACLSALPRRSPDKFAIEGRRRSQKGEREREGEGETVAETRSTPSRTNRGVIIPTYRQRKERKRERSSEKGRQEEEKSKKHRAPPHPSRGSGGWSKKILSLAMGEIATSGGRFR